MVSQKNIKILIIEDSEVVRNMASMMLKSSYSVYTAEDGLKGLQAFRDISPDIVFLDIDLPKINGMKVLKEIMNMNPKAYVAMLTASAVKEAVVESRALGSKAFIGKPFTKNSLLHTVEAAIKESCDTP